MRKLIFSILMILAVNVYSVDIDAENFINLYKGLSKPMSVVEAQSLYTKRYNEGTIKYFKSKCGLRCLFGLNEEWKHEHDIEVMAHVFRRDDLNNILRYSVENIGDTVHLILVMRMCGSDNNKIVRVLYKYEDDSWKVDFFKFRHSIGTDEDIARSKESRVDCRST